MSFAPERIEKTGPESYFVSHGDDKALWVEFYLEAVYMEFESKKQGRPVFVDQEFIRIRTPGIGGNTVERRVMLEGDGIMPADPDRFPQQWRAFTSKQEQVQNGTSIAEWSILRKSQVMEMKGQGIHTIEQVANLPDSNLGILGMDGRRLRDLAKAYLEQGDKQAVVSALTAENERLKLDVETLKAQFAEMAADHKSPGANKNNRKD